MNEAVMMQRPRTIKPHNILTHTMKAARYTLRQNRAFAPCEPAYGQCGNAMPVEENCMNGLVPAESRKKITVPCVLTMTKYLFDHYRLCMYSHLNRSLHSELLQSKRLNKPKSNELPKD